MCRTSSTKCTVLEKKSEDVPLIMFFTFYSLQRRTFLNLHARRMSVFVCVCVCVCLFLCVCVFVCVCVDAHVWVIALGTEKLDVRKRDCVSQECCVNTKFSYAGDLRRLQLYAANVGTSINISGISNLFPIFSTLSVFFFFWTEATT